MTAQMVDGSDTRYPGDGVSLALSSYDTEDGFSKYEEEDSTPAPSPRQRHFPKWAIFYDLKEMTFFILVLLSLVPIILLAAYSPKLSKNLGSVACLPNGEFILPGTASIWDKNLFFTISITIGANSNWSYTQVRIIDLIWDICVGRGGQVVLVYVAYRVFHKFIRYIMESQCVSYSLYGAVAFQTGSASSIVPILSAFRDNRFWNDGRTYRLYTVMILATMYIAAMPSLYSAMSGYAVVASPSIQLPPEEFRNSVNGSQPGPYPCLEEGGCEVEFCGRPGVAKAFQGHGLEAGWGVCLDCGRVGVVQPYPLTVAEPDNVKSYYETYQKDYEAAASDPQCQKAVNLTDCPALARTSIFMLSPNKNLTLPSPMLNIQRWGVDKSSGLPDFWLCNNLILGTEDFWFSDGHMLDQSWATNVTGTCIGGNEYQWGLSFLVLLSVCIAQFIFAALIYGLWVEAHRNGLVEMEKKERGIVKRSTKLDYEEAKPSLLKDVILIASQAEKGYGEEVRGWSRSRLHEVVWKGHKGLRSKID